MHPTLERVVEWFSNVIIHIPYLDHPVLGTEDYRQLTFPLCSTRQLSTLWPCHVASSSEHDDFRSSRSAERESVSTLNG